MALPSLASCSYLCFSVARNTLTPSLHLVIASSSFKIHFISHFLCEALELTFGLINISAALASVIEIAYLMSEKKRLYFQVSSQLHVSTKFSAVGTSVHRIEENIRVLAKWSSVSFFVTQAGRGIDKCPDKSVTNEGLHFYKGIRSICFRSPVSELVVQIL